MTGATLRNTVANRLAVPGYEQSLQFFGRTIAWVGTQRIFGFTGVLRL
jgi:hypothetical protein